MTHPTRASHDGRPNDGTARSSKPLARALLGRMPGFRDCPPEILDLLTERGTLRRYSAGEYVVRRGGENQYLMVVIEGELECSVTRASGAKHLFGFHKPGECTGMISLTEGPGHVIDIVAKTSTTLLAIRKETVLTLMETEPKFSMALFRQLARRARRMYDRVTLDAAVPLKTRLASMLQSLADLYGIQRGEEIILDLKISQADIAASLGVSRQYVNPVLRSLEQEDVIRLHRSSVTIVNPAKLAELADS